MAKLDGVRVAILATDGVEQSEYTRPRKALEEEGAYVRLVAPSGGTIQAFHHFDKGEELTVEATLGEADPDDYDAVMLPGGALNADQLRMDEDARRFVQAADEDGKPIAAICHAPWVLISSRIVENRRLTGYFTVEDDVTNAGGNWEDAPTVRDDTLLTSRGPADIPAFNDAMIELFGDMHAGRFPADRPGKKGVRKPNKRVEQSIHLTGKRGTLTMEGAPEYKAGLSGRYPGQRCRS